MTSYAVIANGTVQVRGLPSMRVAKRIASQKGSHAKAIIDPRCIRER